MEYNKILMIPYSQYQSRDHIGSRVPISIKYNTP